MATYRWFIHPAAIFSGYIGLSFDNQISLPERTATPFGATSHCAQSLPNFRIEGDYLFYSIHHIPGPLNVGLNQDEILDPIPSSCTFFIPASVLPSKMLSTVQILVASTYQQAK